MSSRVRWLLIAGFPTFMRFSRKRQAETPCPLYRRYPLIATMATATGVCVYAMARNIYTNPDVQ
jgi:hypothetical protein